MPRQPRRLETLTEAAERHGVSVSTLRRRIADGTLQAYRHGPKLLRVDPAEVDDALLRVVTRPDERPPAA